MCNRASRRIGARDDNPTTNSDFVFKDKRPHMTRLGAARSDFISTQVVTPSVTHKNIKSEFIFPRPSLASELSVGS
jgi:hypothetical protein